MSNEVPPNPSNLIHVKTPIHDSETQILSLSISHEKEKENNLSSDEEIVSVLNSLESEPSLFLGIAKETWSLFYLAFPILLTNLILYSRSILSMVYLGRIGDNELAAGSLAIAFANITGYSVFSGLASGMEPLCSQAFGANRPKLLSLTLQRCVAFLLVCSMPISLLWLYMSDILVYIHQDPKIAKLAHTYILFSFPDLVTNAFYHPIKIYLRAQGVTIPVTLASIAGAVLHLPIMALLVGPLHLGISGVAIASSMSNLVSLLVLIIQVWYGGLHVKTWNSPTKECLSGWGPLLKLAAPSCVTVCLEWWWYEIMIVLCGLLEDPRATVASMGVLMQTTGLIYNFPASLSNAVSTRVGNELGAGRAHQAKHSGLLGIMWASIMGLVAAFFAFESRDVWAKMFTADNKILTLTATALPILGLCELGNCPQTVAAGVVRGTARPTTAANVVIGAFYIVGMPIAIGLGIFHGVGFVGLWIGLLSAQVTCVGLLLYVVKTTDWDLQAKRAQMLTDSNGPTLSLQASNIVDSTFTLDDDDDDDDHMNDDGESLIRATSPLT